MPLKATETTRMIVRKPLGLLLKRESDLARLLKGFKGVIVTVGDVVSKGLLEKGFNPSLCVVDGRTMRKGIQGVEFLKSGRRVFRLVNPPGEVSDDSWSVFKEALGSTPSIIIVEGEEDLLTLVAIETAPQGSLILYGQPGEGVVAVKVDESSKSLVSTVLKTMRAPSNV